MGLLPKAYRHATMSVIITRGLKHIQDSKIRTPSSARIIKDIDLVLKALEIFYRANGAVVG